MWSENVFLVAGTVANQATIFAITDTKRYVPVIILKLLDQLKTGFRKTINWNKYQS